MTKQVNYFKIINFSQKKFKQKLIMTLKTAVTNILGKRVTDEQAKTFALENYGILATYIRQEFINKIKKVDDYKIRKKDLKTVEK